MTAVAVMQLVEQGLVELDAPIQQHLPWFMPDSPITVRQLLNQTSGLDETESFERNLEADGPDALEQSIRRLAAAELNRSPGEAFEYSNSNYDVLGLLIETVTGQPYADYMSTGVLEPLEMTHTHTSLEAAREDGMSGVYYPFFGRETEFSFWMPYSRSTQPAAGLIASVEDMAHYLMMHLNDGRYDEAQVLPPEGVTALHTPGAEINSELAYAMGWAIWPFEEIAAGGTPPTALSHGGDWLGINNMILLVPERELGVVVLMNRSGDDEAQDEVIFNVAQLALGQERTIPPSSSSFLDRAIKPLSVAVVVLLIAAAVWAFRRLRRGPLTRRDIGLFIGLAIIDLALLVYVFLVRLPQINSSLPLVIRYEPDLGLIFVLFLLLTAVWGTVRTIWAIARRRAVW
jgi:CubicO group peptidase (beta-lactamase class C family)